MARYLGQRNIFPVVHPIGDIDGVPIPGERVNKHVEDFKRFTDIPKGSLLDLIKAVSGVTYINRPTHRTHRSRHPSGENLFDVKVLNWQMHSVPTS